MDCPYCCLEVELAFLDSLVQQCQSLTSVERKERAAKEIASMKEKKNGDVRLTVVHEEKNHVDEHLRIETSCRSCQDTLSMQTSFVEVCCSDQVSVAVSWMVVD